MTTIRESQAAFESALDRVIKAAGQTGLSAAHMADVLQSRINSLNKIGGERKQPEAVAEQDRSVPDQVLQSAAPEDKPLGKVHVKKG